MKRTIGWMLTGMLIFFMAVSFTTDLPIRVDTDVGICIADIDFEMSIPEIEIKTVNDFVTDNCFSYEEVGIVPGLNFNLISDTKDNYILSIEIFQRDSYDNFNKESYSAINIGKLKINKNFFKNSPKMKLIANMHNKESEVSGILPYYKPEIHNKIIYKKS